MSINTQVIANVGKAVGKDAFTYTKPKKEDADKEKTAATKSKNVRSGKTPTVGDVRSAMVAGHITPEEAGSLNPNAGLKPDVNDVREAFNGGHITLEETESLLGRRANSPAREQFISRQFNG
jgi:hypothetical protein